MQIVSERDVAEVRQDPVTVTKAALDLDREHVSGVKLTVSSTARDPVAVEIAEEVPGHVSLGDIQVHPNYGPGKWVKSEAHHRMTFKDEIPPEGSVETVFGVRQAFEELEPFLDDPSVTVVESADAEDDDASAVDAETIDLDTAEASDLGLPEHADAAASTRSGPPGEPETPHDAAGEATTDRGRISAEDPSGRTTAAQAGSNGDASTAPDTAEATADSPPSQFQFGEDRSQNVSADAGRRTGSADEGDSPPAIERSDEAARHRPRGDEAAADHDAELRVQLEHLQSTVARLSAFADAFDAFVGAEGPPAEVVATLRAQHQELVDEVESLAGRCRTNAEERVALEDQVAHLERELADLRATQERQVESLIDRVDELESTFTAEETRAIREVIAAERVWRQHRAGGERPQTTPATGAVDR